MRRRANRVFVTPAPIRRALLVAVAACACSVAQAVEPVYWRQRVFFIPYQAAPGAPAPEKVQLLISRDGVGEWAVLQEAQPHVRGFSYHAPSDGEYAFAVRTVDRRGDVTPTVIAQPQIRIVVDTAPPAIQLTAALDATGRVIVRYEARDLQLKPETLRLEVQADGRPWERLSTGPPDIAQPDRVVGQVAWKPPTSSAKLQFRASIDDRAANQFAATAETSLVGPMLSPSNSGPSFAGPALNAASPPLTAAEAPALIAPLATTAAEGAPQPRAGIDWPSAAESSAASTAGSPPSESSKISNTPPLWPNQRTPAQLVADSSPTKSFSASSSASTNPFSPPPLLSDSSALTPLPPVDSAAQSGWSAPQDQGPAETRWVNSLTFDVDYDVQSVGPWGVSRIDLWATNDGGQQWTKFGVDDDNRSPMRVTVPAGGTYGFRLVVSGANGAAAPAPQAGTTPELTIGVDLQEPQCDLQAAEIGQGNLADHLLVRWSASDDNLDARPIGLFYGSDPQGPWSTIATDIDNNGQYAWRLLRQVPEKLYLRLEVRDKAGNVAIRTSPAPVMLNLPQPTGRLRNVRPVQEDPSRFRTASGSGDRSPVGAK